MMTNMQSAQDIYREIARETSNSKRRELAGILQAQADKGVVGALVPLALLQIIGLNAVKIDHGQVTLSLLFSRCQSKKLVLSAPTRRGAMLRRRLLLATSQDCIFLCKSFVPREMTVKGPSNSSGAPTRPMFFASTKGCGCMIPLRARTSRQ